MWPVDTRVEAEEPDGHLHGASNGDERRTQLPCSRFHPALQIDDDRAERKRYDRLGIHQRYDDVVVNGLAAERASQRARDGTDDEDEIVNTLSDDRPASNTGRWWTPPARDTVHESVDIRLS